MALIDQLTEVFVEFEHQFQISKTAMGQSMVKTQTFEDAENPGFDIDALILMADWEDVKVAEEEEYQGQLMSDSFILS
jgi:hypothetical protein